MSNLYQWQKISRVLSGLPFGNGSDGSYSSATIPTLVKDSCSGTATSKTFVTSGSTFSNGDIILIHQTRGTGVGQWEINRVASGGGSTSLTLQVASNYTYTDSGASQAQAIKILQYTYCTVQSGTWTVPAWDGNVGGVAPFAIKGTLTVTGTISGIGKGYLKTTQGGEYSGEGTSGAEGFRVRQNGNGGGGGYDYGGGGGLHKHGGGGGGNGGAGGDGGYSDGATSSAYGGTTSGAADLTNITFGGAGGVAVSDGGSGSGGGGGMVIIFAKNVTGAGAITLTGTAAGEGGANGGHGGGAGGSALFVTATANLSSITITALGAAGSDAASADGGDGGTGRIAVHHSGAVTGTTNPTFTDVTDGTLVENVGGYMM